MDRSVGMDNRGVVEEEEEEEEASSECSSSTGQGTVVPEVELVELAELVELVARRVEAPSGYFWSVPARSFPETPCKLATEAMVVLVVWADRVVWEDQVVPSRMTVPMR